MGRGAWRRVLRCVAEKSPAAHAVERRRSLTAARTASGRCRRTPALSSLGSRLAMSGLAGAAAVSAAPLEASTVTSSEGAPEFVSTAPTSTPTSTPTSAQPSTQPSTQKPPKPLINLLRGWPATTLLPTGELQTATAALLADDPAVAASSLLYGADAGFEPLREQLAHYLSGVFAAYGAPDDPGRVCVTGGASQGAACVLQSFTDPAYTAAVWLSAPCYYLMCPIFEDAGFAGRLRAVPEDDEGIDIAALERGFAACDAERRADSADSADSATSANSASPAAADTYKHHLRPTRKAYRHIVYLVPASSNPSGRSMSIRRREQLVRLARRHDALLIADDVYDLLQWPANTTLSPSPSVPLPPPPPRLVDIDRMLPPDADADTDDARFGHAISNGSFSKIVAPGMRTGWVDATPAFAFGLSQTGSSRSGGAPSQFAAAAIAGLMRSGALDRHLRDVVRPALQRRHRRLAQAVAAHLSPYVEVRHGGLPGAVDDTDNNNSDNKDDDDDPGYGGYFLWLRLRRPDISATAVAARARAAENLIVAEGPLFRVRGDDAGPRFDDHIRLCFAWEDEDRLDEGVRRLARVLRDWDALPLPAADAPDPGPAAVDDFK